MSSSVFNTNSYHKPTFTVIIQARMGSTRLPGKALLDLSGKPMLAHVIERSKAISGISSVVLATGSINENRALIDLANSMDIHAFSGSDENVLERFYKAAEVYGGDYIVRITGDNPFMDPEYATYSINTAKIHEPDLCSIINLPLGVAIEIIKRQALITAYENSDKQYQFEHVTPYIKENVNKFHIFREKISYQNPFHDLRLTVDEKKDYQLASIIYRALYQGSIFSLKQIIDYLSQNPDLIQINRDVHQKSMKETSQS